MSATGIFWLCYFAPAIIALLRSHRHAALIVMLNALLGWTIVGWLFALLWSFTDTGRAPRPAHCHGKVNQ